MSAATWSKTQPLPENASFAAAGDDVPLTVRQAATYLGCQRPNGVSLGRAKADSPSPRDGPKHPVSEIGSRALPRNIQTGGGNWQDRVNTMAPYTRAKTARSYGWSIETGTESVSGNQRTRKIGRRPSGNLRERLQARDDRILDIVRKGEQIQFSDWVDFFLENYSKPPIRAEKTHQRTSVRVGTSRRRLASGRLATSRRMTLSTIFGGGFRRGVQFKTAAGVIQKDRLKPATVHQELRVLRRMLNVAVRKKLLPANPCSGWSFP
jgi:hypothetical protein